jgi:hypothetical protein
MTSYAPIVSVRSTALLGLLLTLLAGCGQATCNNYVAPDQPAILELSCGPTDLTDVSLSGSCSTGDAGLSSLFGSTTNSLAVTSARPGDCHVILTFANGFTSSTDLTFVSQTLHEGCVNEVYTVPTMRTVAIDNPPDTCLDAGMN